jgi:hypothetical protein
MNVPTGGRTARGRFLFLTIASLVIGRYNG